MKDVYPLGKASRCCDPGDLGILCLIQALLAARNSTGVVFLGTFGTLAYVLMFHGDLDAVALIYTLFIWCFSWLFTMRDKLMQAIVVKIFSQQYHNTTSNLFGIQF